MNINDIHEYNLPDISGVYFFKKGNHILYIGKATSIRNRVRSYFRDDLYKTRSSLIQQMINEATSVTFETTDTVLEALVLEASLIKKYQPPYNTNQKDNKSFTYVVITDEYWPRILTVRGRELDSIQSNKSTYHSVSTTSTKTILTHVPIRNVFGPFTSSSMLREALKIIRKIFPYRDRKCMPAEEQRNPMKPSPCFNKQIGLCPGVCTNEISHREYLRYIRNITLFFEGKKKKLCKTLEREMNSAVRKQNFEYASHLRDTLFALNHINDVALLKHNFESTPSDYAEHIFRIEGYDVAHMAGEGLVGVMVVAENDELRNDKYRTFSIKEQIGIDDTRALAEILERRLRHTKWDYPDLIVVDGGKAQKNTAKRVLKNANISLPVVAVRKDEHHKPRDILADTHQIGNEYQKTILKVNAEAHRFAIQYHRKVLRKNRRT